MALLPYIVHLPLIFSLCFLIKKKYSAEPLAVFFWPGLLLKATAGIVLGLLYFYYYPGGDTTNFQFYANTLTEYLHSDQHKFVSVFFLNEFNETTKSAIPVWEEPRTMFMVRLISIQNLFTFNNYWINGLYFSIFSFTGLWFLGNRIVKQFKISKEAVAFSFLFFPSVIFWSSGLIKDSLLVGIICFIVFLFLKIQETSRIQLKDLILLVALFYFGWKVKFYYTAVLTALILSYFITHFLLRQFNIKKSISAYFILPLIFLGLGVVASLFIPSLNLNYLLFIMHYSYDLISKGSGDFTFHHLNPELSSYIFNFPQALYTGLFRPLPWEVSGILPLLVGLENFILLVLFIGFLFSLIKSRSAKISLIPYSLFLYVFLLAALMAFIAPNWGTLSRYKAGYLMFWLLLLSHQNPLVEIVVNKIRGLAPHSKNSMES